MAIVKSAEESTLVFHSGQCRNLLLQEEHTSHKLITLNLGVIHDISGLF